MKIERVKAGKIKQIDIIFLKKYIKKVPEAILSPLFILFPIAKVYVCGDKDAEEGVGVDHLTLNLGHPGLSPLQVFWKALEREQKFVN